jgi:hypothetical protein
MGGGSWGGGAFAGERDVTAALPGIGGGAGLVPGLIAAGGTGGGAAGTAGAVFGIGGGPAWAPAVGLGAGTGGGAGCCTAPLAADKAGI